MLMGPPGPPRPKKPRYRVPTPGDLYREALQNVLAELNTTQSSWLGVAESRDRCRKIAQEALDRGR